RLAKEQAQLQQELRNQMARLQKARAQNAARAANRAAGRMAQAQQNQQDDDAEDAEMNQEEALADLEEAQDEAEQAREDGEEELALEQLSRFADNLRAIAEQQDKLVAETTDYDKKAETGGLSPAQRASVRALGRTENSLRQEAGDLADRLPDAPVFTLT